MQDSRRSQSSWHAPEGGEVRIGAEQRSPPARERFSPTIQFHLISHNKTLSTLVSCSSGFVQEVGEGAAALVPLPRVNSRGGRCRGPRPPSLSPLLAVRKGLSREGPSSLLGNGMLRGGTEGLPELRILGFPGHLRVTWVAH